MFDMGFGELLLIGVVALLVLGPERLPGAARTAGQWVGRVRATVTRLTGELERELRADELRRSLREESREIEQAAGELRDLGDRTAAQLRDVTAPPKAPTALPARGDDGAARR